MSATKAKVETRLRSYFGLRSLPFTKDLDADDAFLVPSQERALGRADEATPWFTVAHDRLHGDEWLQAEEPERLARLKELGGG